MRTVCFHHAGCPDGFGAAWAVRQALGDEARFVPRGHDDALVAGEFQGARVIFVDIAPSNPHLRALLDTAAEVVVLDHHVSSKERFLADAELVASVKRSGHLVHFDLDHSGAVLAWNHFHPGTPAPWLLRYVEDQDLWRFKLPESHAVNAALSSYPHDFAVWDELGAQEPESLVEPGQTILRARRREIDAALRGAHSLWLGQHRVEAVNSGANRSHIGHELASRARYGNPCGAVYRAHGRRIDVSVYSIGDFDVATIAAERGGGGHRNAAGFSVPIDEWLERYL